ncbi:unnamed protein product [Trichogramma brassicae]|uniref:Uncharacterized protein n=1 Tax=Trichogramma brassicae TaxID=86971 RepID=A0A6H5J9V6_9HYME|nr:unnamed protein product [Trichogramma brassicae]
MKMVEGTLMVTVIMPTLAVTPTVVVVVRPMAVTPTMPTLTVTPTVVGRTMVAMTTPMILLSTMMLLLTTRMLISSGKIPKECFNQP